MKEENQPENIEEETRLETQEDNHFPDELTETLIEEANWLKLEGRVFCLDPKKAAKTVGEHAYKDDKGNDILIEFFVGQPSVTEYKLVDAVMRKMTSEGPSFPQTVILRATELAGLMKLKMSTNKYGKKTLGTWQGNDIRQAGRKMRRTHITADFYDKETTEWMNLDFSFFSNVVLVGEKHGDSRKIRAAAYTVDPLIVKSLAQSHYACLNWERLSLLGPIARVFMKRLHWHFSNLYGGHLAELEKRKSMSDLAIRAARKKVRFRKRYDVICQNWLGGMVEYRYKADIKRQLEPHIKQLKLAAYIRKWDIEPTKRGGGWNLIFWPGRGFFNDYDAFYLSHLQPSLQFNQSADRMEFQQPIDLVSHFYRALHGSSAVDVEVLGQNEIDLAAQLIDKYGLDAAKDLVDHTIENAKTTNFSLNNFSGVKLQVQGWLAKREKEEARSQTRESARAEELQDNREREYQRFVQEHVRRILEGGLDSETRSLCQEAERRFYDDPKIQELSPAVVKQTAQMGIRIQLNKLILEKYPVSSFEEWVTSIERGIRPD